MRTYIDAALRSSRTNEAYIFTHGDYLVLNYSPGTTNGRVLNGPHLICEGYPSLAGTLFGEYGIYGAFGSCDGDGAFIFSGNLCARIKYAPGTTNDWIINYATTIGRMFPFLRGTVFEDGIDGAFESTRRYEAYLFNQDQYALINYDPDGSHLIAIHSISQGFPSLRGTIFETGIDAAFASHIQNQAYLFKGDSYALINFDPATRNDYIVGGVRKILRNWPCLRDILPHHNRGLDVHSHTTFADVAHYRHGEL